MDDPQIIALYERRAEAAIKETDRKYGSLLYSQARNILFDRRDSEEAVSETYLKIWNTIPPEKPLHFKAWLFKLARHICIDRYRAINSKKRRAGEYALSLEELSDCVSGEQDVESQLAQQELCAAIDGFLRQLPRQQRGIFLQRYFFADPVKRIASDHRLKEANVKTMLYRTRQGLKHYLQQEGFVL